LVGVRSLGPEADFFRPSPYHTVLFDTVLFDTVLFETVPWKTVPYDPVPGVD
jgi:hypothetical protein